MMKKIIIVTADPYPNDTAGVIRTHAFAKIFSKLGLCPLVVGMGE